MSYLNSNQRGLLSTEYLFDIKSFSEYEVLFSYFPSIPEGVEILKDRKHPLCPALSTLST